MRFSFFCFHWFFYRSLDMQRGSGPIPIFNDWKCDFCQWKDTREVVRWPIRDLLVNISALWIYWNRKKSICRDCVQRIEIVDVRQRDEVLIGEWTIHWHRWIVWIVIPKHIPCPHRWPIYATNCKISLSIRNDLDVKKQCHSRWFTGTHLTTAALVISFGMCEDQKWIVFGAKSGRTGNCAHTQTNRLWNFRDYSYRIRSNQWFIENTAIAAKPFENAQRTNFR